MISVALYGQAVEKALSVLTLLCLVGNTVDLVI